MSAIRSGIQLLPHSSAKGLSVDEQSEKLFKLLAMQDKKECTKAEMTAYVEKTFDIKSLTFEDKLRELIS